MQTEAFYKNSNVVHVFSMIPFVAGFATSNWAIYYTPTEIREFGLWNMCVRDRNTTSVNGTVVETWREQQLQVCDAHNIHELSGRLARISCYYLKDLTSRERMRVCTASTSREHMRAYRLDQLNLSVRMQPRTVERVLLRAQP
ncbi:hypothetical protein PoB_003204900 [Plakobranchus ocellatus]|uniref:Uncharacterized protein n=1 Tax=Plakobranchus ocellatus TaxID=259542 RepID=A0AAV4AGJ6_9GAST|nr:hypothetical protein PoB_003204900 [Plakobranchus ocellatus]